MPRTGSEALYHIIGDVHVKRQRASSASFACSATGSLKVKPKSQLSGSSVEGTSCTAGIGRFNENNEPAEGRILVDSSTHPTAMMCHGWLDNTVSYIIGPG